MSELEYLVKDVSPILFSQETIDFVSPNVVLKNIDCVGSLIATSFRILFISQESSSLIALGTIAIAAIERATKLQITKFADSRLLQIHGKDARTIVFSFRPHTHQRREVFNFLEKRISCALFFPWQANPDACEIQIRISVSPSRPSLLSSEYARILRNIQNETTKKWRLSEVNLNYEMSPTYPSSIVLPSSISDEEALTASTFRSKGRIPVFCWQHPKTGAVLSRSSQPLAGLMINSKRSEIDEKLVRALNGSDTIKMVIADARPRKNALANGAMGGGIEHSSNYPFAEVFHFGCENIHVIRESMSRLREYLNHHGSSSLGFHTNILRSENTKWTSGNMPSTSSAPQCLQETSWLHHVHILLSGATFIAAKLSLSSSSVLVHCSDGWDRTPSLICLSLLLLDPYYRTFEGFRVLVETHWCAFGHPFSERMGIISQPYDSLSNPKLSSVSSPNLYNNSTKNSFNNINSTRPVSPSLSSPPIHSTTPSSSTSIGSVGTHQSPIFFQWLDCVAQLLYLFPCAFEFSTLFLVDLLDNFLGCYFKNFYGNCEKERREIDSYENGKCVWEHLEKQRQCCSSPCTSLSRPPSPTSNTSYSSIPILSLTFLTNSPLSSCTIHPHYNILYQPSDYDHPLLPPAAALTPILIPHFYYRWCFPTNDNDAQYCIRMLQESNLNQCHKLHPRRHLNYWDVNCHTQLKFNSLMDHMDSIKASNERGSTKIQQAENQISSLSLQLEQAKKSMEEEKQKNHVLERNLKLMEYAFHALGRTCHIHHQSCTDPNASDKAFRFQEANLLQVRKDGVPHSNDVDFPAISVTYLEEKNSQEVDYLQNHHPSLNGWCKKRESCELPDGLCVSNMNSLNGLYAEFGALDPTSFRENYFGTSK